MGLDILILNSGYWSLAEELPANPWHVLIYRQGAEPRNELHLWLPRRDAQRSADYVFKRYWVDSSTRWCVETPDVPPGRGRSADAARVRFSAQDGRVLWAVPRNGRGLADLTEYDLTCLRDSARAGSFTTP